ncbi:MAG: hypothetical protein R3B45_14985 [Bdellovibrionota bacterium]
MKLSRNDLLNHSRATIAFTILTLMLYSSCRTPEDTDDVFDPLKSEYGCVENFKHSSALQSLIIKNDTSKMLSLAEITSLKEGKAIFDEKNERNIAITPGQSHTLYFIVDSFANGTSMVYQATDKGEKLMSFDPICVESSQAPLYLRHSEGEFAWLGLKPEDTAARNLSISLSDAWAESAAAVGTHTLTVDEKTFTDNSSKADLELPTADLTLDPK